MQRHSKFFIRLTSDIARFQYIILNLQPNISASAKCSYKIKKEKKRKTKFELGSFILPHIFPNHQILTIGCFALYIS